MTQRSGTVYQTKSNTSKSEDSHKFKVIDGSIGTRTILHKFRMGDVEDPVLMAGAPIYDWQQTEHGKWCMENALGEMVFHTQPDHMTFGYTVVIVGYLKDTDLTYFNLKWGMQ
jgi:hypothetical protein